MKTPEEYLEELIPVEFLQSENAFYLDKDVEKLIQQVQKDAYNQALEDITDRLELLISLNEDDLDRGKGKYIINNEIQELKRQLEQLK